MSKARVYYDAECNLIVNIFKSTLYDWDIYEDVSGMCWTSVKKPSKRLIFIGFI